MAGRRPVTLAIVSVALFTTVMPITAAEGVTCVQVAASRGDSIQRAATASPTGTRFCLSGTFTINAPIVPKDGQSFVGPATIAAASGAETAFELKPGSTETANASNVTIENLEIRGFALNGIECWTGTIIRNSNIHHNARNGIGCGLDGSGGVLIVGNSVHHNGTPTQAGKGAAGMKFGNVNGVTIRGNLVEANIGNGIWCDMGCRSFTVDGNTVRGSTRKGIMYEISYGPALIVNNIVKTNNCSPVYWPNPNPACPIGDGKYGPQSIGAPGGGIAANSSKYVTIRGNTLGGNMSSGISLRDDSRQYQAPFVISISGNVMNGDKLNGCTIAGVSCS
jgi:hypothetical protein